MRFSASPCGSWGRPAPAAQEAVPLPWLPQVLPLPAAGRTVLPYGLGRSYGDSCLNGGHRLLLTAGLRRFIAFDTGRGVLRCEAGVTLEAILKLVVPHGWFLPVTPGTKFVTVGGAIANDVHGKNHHRAATFGCHVARFELLRSDGRRLECAPDGNADFFAATIGGLGLTGLITWAELRLRRVASAWLNVQTQRFRALDEFFDLAEDDSHEHRVAWIDAAAGRGIFTHANHAAEGDLAVHRRDRWTVPIDAPAFLLRPLAARAFNLALYSRHRAGSRQTRQHYGAFFYPLDRLQRWNRLYGRDGFYQYQAVVPPDSSRQIIAELLARVAGAGAVPLLGVLKIFGKIRSPGLLSFPREGVTLSLDFVAAGAPTLRLFERLDEIVRGHGGAIYPAKDARMSAGDFQSFFPQWRQFAEFIDPAFGSSFWRRVTGGAPS